MARETILKEIEKPGRYLGGEWNAVRKDPKTVHSKVALVFPDVYEIGMSYLGQKILYSLLNDQPSILAERVFAPWTDFEHILRSRNIPLYSLENKIPLARFDIVGFSLLYELNYSNVLTILDLGHIPLRASKRNLDFPLVIAGGPAAFNPEPVAEFFDGFLIGDGEEAFLEIIEKYTSLKKSGRPKREILKELAGIQGVYVPSFYEPYFPRHSALLAVKPDGEAPARITKRVLFPFRHSCVPDNIPVPNVQIVFDRISIEVARGCPHRCRFCQAASLYFPFRVKDPSFVVQKIFQALRSTGYEDLSLFSLSVGDYPYLEGIIRILMEAFQEKSISLSLSSLRPKGLSSDIVQNILKVRKTGFTLVPEAGTERLRRVINKNLKDQEIWEAATNAFSQGWQLLKLYFMIGLPHEKEEDLLAIISLVKEIVHIGRKILKATPRIHMSLSSFIPKPHTPFQWLAMEDEQVLLEKQKFIWAHLRPYPYIQLKEHAVKSSILEAVFSRGDRRLANVLQKAWTRGARFDSWKDHFQFPLWEESLTSEGLDYRLYLGSLSREAVLPWDHIQTGMKKSFMLNELDKAMKEEGTPSCLETQCGLCQGCDFPEMVERKFPEKIDVRTEWPSPWGRKKEIIHRYQAFYEKAGNARFFSHNDLVNILQRSLRRANVHALHSQGFHPKMILSFVPAIPLGMTGKEESFEFKSHYEFGEKEFVLRLNQCVPPGIRFLKLKKLKNSAPSLHRRIHLFVYSLDLNLPEIRAAIESMARKKNLISGGEKVVQDLIQAYSEKRDESIEQILYDAENQKINFHLRHSPQRDPRIQDIVEETFGIKNSVYFLTRERIIFHKDALTDSRSAEPASVEG
ncbi:MAG: TIGR03960 family B12-binding radical SAM protein [Candidatus Aminicenantales bacterium]